MRLSDVLSKPCFAEFVPIEGFLTKKLYIGKHQEIKIGQVALNFYCQNCGDTRTFWSDDKLYCIGVSPRLISIDCVLKCGCNSSVVIWFLVESFEDDIGGLSPTVRILKRREKLSEQVRLVGERYADYADLLDKAERAYRDGLGAGSLVYLRKIFEQITTQTANALSISCNTDKGKRKPFKQLLEEVDKRSPIIPEGFRENGYRLFGELSDVVHGEFDEQLGLDKFGALHRLVVGIVDNVNNSRELQTAIGSLGWSNRNGGDTQ
jgi:hypothetical protein